MNIPPVFTFLNRLVMAIGAPYWTTPEEHRAGCNSVPIDRTQRDKSPEIDLQKITKGIYIWYEDFLNLFLESGFPDFLSYLARYRVITEFKLEDHVCSH